LNSIPDGEISISSSSTTLLPPGSAPAGSIRPWKSQASSGFRAATPTLRGRKVTQAPRRNCIKAALKSCQNGSGRPARTGRSARGIGAATESAGSAPRGYANASGGLWTSIVACPSRTGLHTPRAGDGALRGEVPLPMTPRPQRQPFPDCVGKTCRFEFQSTPSLTAQWAVGGSRENDVTNRGAGATLRNLTVAKIATHVEPKVAWMIRRIADASYKRGPKRSTPGDWPRPVSGPPRSSSAPLVTMLADSQPAHVRRRAPGDRPSPSGRPVAPRNAGGRLRVWATGKAGLCGAGYAAPWSSAGRPP
jgi:hypothetical protein